MSRENNIGPYELRGEIGRGAMARVWRAWDPTLEREVAIKEPLISEDVRSEVREEMAHRFVKEAKAAAKLNHPNIVSIYAADIYDGHPAIVMELVEGATLGQVIEANGKLDTGTALSILDGMLDGVGYAHAQGVVHRDLKPDNIFLTTDGRAKIGDFGIAHVDSAAQTHATQLGTVLGTPGYMSPEQARGTAVDGRSDLFSIGVIAYEMLSGKNPFGADSADPTTVLYRIAHEEVPELATVCGPGIEASVDAAIMSALKKDPGERPATAEALKAALHGGKAPSPQPVPIPDLTKGPGLPSWLPYVAVVAICAVVVGGIFLAAGSGAGGGGVPVSVSTGTNSNVSQTDTTNEAANVNATNQNANASSTSSTATSTAASPFASHNTGDVVQFGTYQGQAVDWRILDIFEGKALVITEYVVDAVRYGDSSHATWESSNLKTWMESFYNSAFTDAEKASITFSSDVDANLFALSSAEADRYFKDDADRAATPTQYAKDQGVWMGYGSPWWLRDTATKRTSAGTPMICYVWAGTTSADAGRIDTNGYGPQESTYGARPAMWVEL